MYIKEGARLTYVGQVTKDITASWPDILSAISSSLAIVGIVVEESHVNTQVFSFVATATLKVLTRTTDYANENDVRAIVDHYFYTEAGTLPVSSRITSVTQPGKSPTDTGAPQEPKETDSGSIGGWFESIGDKLTGAGYGLVFGAVGVVLLLLVVAAKHEIA